jgi:hypothetical protein
MSELIAEDPERAADGEPPPREEPRSLRAQAESDLQLALWVLCGLTLLLLPVGYLMTWSQPAQPGDALPVGVHIENPGPLALDEAEAARFDASVFGSVDGGDRSALSDLRLPPRVPTLTERPWALSSHSELSTPAVKAALDALRRCADTQGCDPRQGEVLNEALTAVAAPAADSSGPCNRTARTAGDVQVPVGLHAIVLSYFPECRDAARQRFAVLAEKIDYNIKAGMLHAPQSVAAQVYARLSAAKLAEPARAPGGAEFLAEIRALRALILATPGLREPYERAQELPQWGLSMAEIRAEWLMAEARELARHGRGPGLATRLNQAQLLDPHVLTLLSAAGAPALGQARLKLTWCALALRAGVPEGASETCLATLAHAVSLQSLHCAVVARVAVASGRWEVTGSDCSGDRDSAPETSAAGVFEQMARNHGIWGQVLQHYLHGGNDADEHARLRSYLAAYAGLSHNMLTWFRVQHPRPFVVLLAGFVVLLVGWVGLAWAYFVRRRQLHRFLPAPLAAD